jgi:dihydrolipoamide dehydrogenase
MSKPFDVIVIGGGPGGYVAAIRAAQLDLNVACIDAWQNSRGGPALGGTCTNVGCIPSKALLQSSEYYEHTGRHLAEHGIEVKGLGLDLGKLIERKDAIIKKTNEGIAYLFKKNQVTFFHGVGSFLQAVPGGYEVAVKAASCETLIGKHIIIATGSSARALPGVPFDEQTVLSNIGALRMETVPDKLVLIGSGVIGLEMGSVWRRLGADVTVLEALPTFLGPVDEQIAREAHKAFDRQGLKIELGVKVSQVKTTHKSTKNRVIVAYADATGTAHTIEADKLIVSIGRVPHTTGLNAEGVGLQLGERGDIVVDDQCRTNLPGVWAIGDVVRGPMLAHKAEEEGVAVAERIAGQHGHMDFNTIPWVIYTSPEIAWVGKTEQQLKAEGVKYKAGTFPFIANGRARALGDTTGMVKFLADAATDEILGVHIVGPLASELIAEAVVAMAFKASSEDIARICHAHPSLSEATKEAALAVDQRTLNF